MPETVFSKIVRKEIPAKIVYEDDVSLAFHDLQAQAPVHVLVIPKRQIDSIEHATDEDAALLGHLQIVIQKVARILNIHASGYRVVMNCGGMEANRSAIFITMSWRPTAEVAARIVLLRSGRCHSRQE